jgi:hypothetical protein
MASLLRPTSWIMLIIKMFVLAKRFREPLSYPTKGQIRHNIFKSIGLGFTYGPWFPINRTLQEEGYLLCTSCTNVFSYQEWRQRADMAFES